MNGLGWIGIDLDGTLADDTGEMFDIEKIGDPVPEMTNFAKLLLENGYEVKIMTARVAVTDKALRNQIISAIQAWTLKHIGYTLTVTCVKDMNMIALFDDRAIGVKRNTGKIMGPLPKFLDVFPFSHALTTWKP